MKIFYDCKSCSGQEKKNRGCKRERRGEVARIDCTCNENKKCTLCKGSGIIILKRCPVATVRESGIRILLPYFFHYLATGMTQYPDGRGMVYQPRKLLNAFSIMNAVYIKATEVQREIEKAEHNGRRPQGSVKTK